MLGQNLVYGEGSAAEEEALDVLYIIDAGLNVLKEYRVGGGYISGADGPGLHPYSFLFR